MPDIELPASTESGGAALRSGTLSMPKVLGMGASYLAPGAIVIYNVVSIGLTVGKPSWLTIVLDLPAFAALVVVVGVFAKRYVVTGSLMSYLGEAFGSKSRILGGAPLLVGYFLSMPLTAIFVLTFAQGLLLDFKQTWASTATSQVVIVAIVTIIAGYIAYRGVNLSARFAIICTLICAPFVIILMVASIIHNGASGFGSVFTTQGLNSKSLPAGLVLVFVGLVGFEGFTALGRETKDPVKNTMRILPILVGLVVVVLLLGCFTFVPLLLQHTAEISAGQSPSAIIADATGVSWMKIPLDATLLLATFSGMIAVFNDAARVTSTAARDGMLPKGLGLISAKTGTPARAIVAMAVLGIGIPAISQYVVQQSPIQASTALGPTLVYLWLVPYLAMSIGVIAIKAREGRIISWASLAGAFAFLFLLALGIYSIATASGAIQRVAPAATLAVAAVIFVIAIIRRRSAGTVASANSSAVADTTDAAVKETV